ncbi:helix-turn-helix domain-containing protein [Spiroplasma endosymbiont of Cantharis nigra]|uniref:helix-turn-helix domain-containing protein n=1 Tax=Spiroplasma endosymbiont of Cantharis nigra TaxID=3066278 RepID=UPI0030D5BDC3
MANFKGNKSNMVSLETKIEVAKDWAINQQSWKKLAKKHNVSYSAARKWALGYEEYGIEYLKKISSRKGQTAGIKKIDIELKNSPFKKEIMELKKKNKLLEMENEILKKFNQFLEDSEKNSN